MKHVAFSGRWLAAVLFAIGYAGIGSSPAIGAIGDPPYASVNLGSALDWPGISATVSENAAGEVVDYDPNNSGGHFLQVWIPTTSNGPAGAVKDLTSALGSLPIGTAPAAQNGSAMEINNSGEIAVLVQSTATSAGTFAVLCPGTPSATSYSATMLGGMAVDAGGNVSFEFNDAGELAAVSDSRAPMILEAPLKCQGSDYHTVQIGSSLRSIFTSSLNSYGEVALGGVDSSFVGHLILWSPKGAHGYHGSETDLSASIPGGLAQVQSVQVNDRGQILLRYQDQSFHIDLALWTPAVAHAASGTWISYDSYLPASTSIGNAQLNNYGQVLINSIDLSGNDAATLVTPTAPNSASALQAETITEGRSTFSLNNAELSGEGAVLLLGYDSSTQANTVAIWAPDGRHLTGGMSYNVSSRVTPSLPTNLATGAINAGDTLLLSTPIDSELYLVTSRQK